jgi:hypothetical protein
MPLASGVGRVARATGGARAPGASGEDRAGSSRPEKPPRRWCPWAEGRAPVSWAACGFAPGDAEARWRFGERVFSADFDGGNLARVERVTDTSFHLWTRPDNQGTPYETHHRTWFHFRVDGCRAGETLTFSFPDFNKQKTLFSNDFRPTYRVHDDDRSASSSSDADAETATTDDGSNEHLQRDRRVSRFHMRAYERIPEPVSARPGRDGAFRVTFKHRFDSDASVFFALSFPFSYADVGLMLDRVDAKFRERTSHGDAMRARVSYARSLLATSVEGRKVEMVTITAAERDGCETKKNASENFGDEKLGFASDDVERVSFTRATPSCTELTRDVSDDDMESSTASSRRANSAPNENSAVPRVEDRDVFVVTCGVHPGEKPANHLFNGVVEFLLRADDARAKRLRELYVFQLVPMLNPDGAFRGHYRHDALGQNLNRHYEKPEISKQPSCAAVKDLLVKAARNGRLGFYIDLHAHANKRGVFAFGNCDLRGDGNAETRAYAQLCALNSPHFDLNHCNFSRKNMFAVDKNGENKAGTGRVALFRETGGTVPHLYTVEANYNCSRVLNRVTDKTRRSSHDGNEDVAGFEEALSGFARRARIASSETKKKSPGSARRYDPETLRGVGRALLVAALDLREENPWSRVPSSAFGSVRSVRTWAKAAARGDAHAAGDDAESEDDETKTSGEDGEPSLTRATREKKPSVFRNTSLTLASSKARVPGRRALDTANGVWPPRRAPLADFAPKWRT